MLRIAQEAVREKKVDTNLLRNLFDQVTIDTDLLKDDECLSAIRSLSKIVVDKKMVEQMSENETGRDLIVNFYETLQSKLDEKRHSRLIGIFSEVTEWIKQQK